MAQDFGDDIGEAMIRQITNAAGRIAWHYVDTHAKEWFKQRALDEGTSPEEAEKAAVELTSREQTCLAFGTADDAALFAQVCRQDGTYVRPLADEEGNGFVQFAVADAAKMGGSTTTFAQLIAARQVSRIEDALGGEPLTRERVEGLTEVTDLPEIPRNDASVPSGRGDVQAEAVRSNTQEIADKVRDARDASADFDEFQRVLAAQGIGVTTTVRGENLFYKARVGERGELLPFDHDKRDWSVGADRLREGYGVDATHDWFEAARGGRVPHGEQQVADGSLDMRGDTPDLNQGIESHDGMDTNTQTARMEFEATGSGDTPPSRARASRGAYDLASESKAARAASKQLEQESGIDERVTDISDKLNPTR